MPRVPEALKHPTKEIDILRARIRMFWQLRYLMAHLTGYSSESNQTLKRNPLSDASRPVDTWTEGQCVNINKGVNPVELVLANIRINKKMEVRHILFDSDYFLLVEISH